MPTKARPQFAAAAVEMFRAQGWGNKELVVVDEPGSPSFFDPQVFFQQPASHITYCRETYSTLGDKRNAAVALTKGDIILHWDDDDQYAPDRIEHQVNILLSRNVDLVAYHTMKFRDLDTGDLFLFHGDTNYAIGTSFCYWRATWERRHFAPRNEAEDWSFRQGRRVYSCPADDHIIGSIHSGCTVDRRVIIEKSERWERL